MHRYAGIAIVAVAFLGLGGAQQAVATPAATHSSAPLVSAAASNAHATKDGRALKEGLAFAQGFMAKKLAGFGDVDVAALRKENSTAEQRRAVGGVVPDPPQGYVQEAAWLATADSKAYCEAEGQKGISAGRWTAYVCRTEPRGELPLFFQVLYVKK